MKRKRGSSWKDLLKGRALRDRGVARALDHDPAWTAAAQKVVLHLCETQPGREMRGEEISAEILRSVGAPPDYHALGGIGLWYVNQGLVVLIKHEPMRLPRSHARSTPRYRLVNPRDAVPRARAGDSMPPLQEAAE